MPLRGHSCPRRRQWYIDGLEEHSRTRLILAQRVPLGDHAVFDVKAREGLRFKAGTPYSSTAG